MRDRQGFILVFDITNPASVDDLNEIYHQILRNKLSATSPSDNSAEPAVPLVLVGNKLDLGNERKVPGLKGKELAAQWKCSYYEASAKMRMNVDEIFLDLVGQILREEKMKAGDGTVGSVGLEEKEEAEDEFSGVGCCLIS